MTKSTYEIVIAEGLDSEKIKRIDPDGQIWWIPKDETNADYRAYLESLKS